MQTTAKIFTIMGVFFTLMTAVYAYATHTWAPEGMEPAGVCALAFDTAMAFMVAFYLSATNKRRAGHRYDDDARGEIADAEGDYGFFSPYSWTPIALAGAAALVVMGVAVGWWMFFLAAGVGIFALVNWVFEYFVGPHHV